MKYRILLLLLLATQNTVSVASVKDTLPVPVAKAIARLESVNAAELRYATVEQSLMSTHEKRDTFALKVFGLHDGPFRLMINKQDHKTSLRDSFYTSVNLNPNEVFYDTIPKRYILDRIGYEVFNPIFNAGSKIRERLLSGNPIRCFDTLIGRKTLHGYAVTEPVDDPSDTMIGPVTRTYVVDDDSNLISYNSAGIAFHQWSMNGVELLSAHYNSISESGVDSAVHEVEQLTQKDHYKVLKQRSDTSLTAGLPKEGTILSFSGTAPDGSSLSLDSIHSKVILLDFWYSGCGYCRYAMPFLRSLQSKYQNSGFTIVGVDPFDDEPAIVRKVVQSESLTNPEIMVDRKVTDSLGVWVYPTFIFLDSDHKLLSSRTGYMKDYESEIEKQIEEYLAKGD
jgi:thiol-disulfide isomerase/thioredoxin